MARRWVVGLALAAGCYSPSLEFMNGQLACSAMNECPTGFHCATDDKCWKAGMNPPPDAMPPDDAAEYDLVVDKTGAGLGAISATGLTCVGPTCTGTYVEGTQVTVMARTQNGDDSYFQGWSGDCATARTARDCVVTMNGPRAATGSFQVQTHNLVFTSSESYSPALVGASKYDMKCNQLASAAGINNGAGDGFVAYMSDSVDQNQVAGRLKVTPGDTVRRGFIRMDGRPVANSVVDGTTHVIFHSPSITELGTRLPRDALVWTGNQDDGTTGIGTAETCVSWSDSSSSAMGTMGLMYGGPGVWTDGGKFSCDRTAAIRCVSKMKDVDLPAIPVIPVGGRVAFVTQNEIGVSTQNTMNVACNTDRLGSPFEARTFLAFVSTTVDPASLRLIPGATYYRPDGTAIGTAADLARGTELDSGLWQTSHGAYAAQGTPVWTGSTSPDVKATDATSCMNWASGGPGDTVILGVANDAARYWREKDDPVAGRCQTTARVYCVEVDP